MPFAITKETMKVITKDTVIDINEQNSALYKGNASSLVIHSAGKNFLLSVEEMPQLIQGKMLDLR